jgi:hypothetical protein
MKFQKMTGFAITVVVLLFVEVYMSDVFCAQIEVVL